MRSLRNITLSALLTIGAFGAVTYTACNKDECKDVVCQNNGTCVNGNCSCPTGFEGTRCETEVRAKFKGIWTAKDEETDGTIVPTYTSTITDGVSVNAVSIGHFSDSYFINDVKGTVSGDVLTVPSQDVDGDGYKVAGSAQYNDVDGKLSWTYTITSPLGAVLTYTGVWQ